MQLINPKRTASFRGNLLTTTLRRLHDKINQEEDIRLGCELQLVTAEEALKLKNAQDGSFTLF